MRRPHAIALTAALCALLAGPSGQAGAPAKAPSLVYPVHSAVTFSHAAHTDAPCATCHAGVLKSRRARDRNTPGMQACVGCHADQTPRLHDCAGCHPGHVSIAPEALAPGAAAWRKVRPAPMVLPRPQADLKFSHAVHAAQPCASCHAGPDEPTMPSMASCQTCHDGALAEKSCATCHPTGAQGLLRPSHIPDALVAQPARALKPQDHAVDWLARHGPIAKAMARDCASCHTEQSCTDCHQTSAPGARLAAHPSNFIVLHRVAARGQADGCTSCHQHDTSCASCHIQSGAATVAAGAPAARLIFHPPGWLDASSATRHGVMARRDLNACASCHQERDCVSCHQGINPHPPDFLGSCQKMLRANPTPCMKCHVQPRCT